MTKIISFRNRVIGMALLTLLMAKSNNAFAGVDPPVIQVLDGSLNQIAINATATVEDSKFFDPAYYSLVDKPYPLKNVITVMLNEDANIVLQSAFTATISLRINYVQNDSTTGTIDRNFTVTYNPNGTYNQKDVYIMNNWARVEVKILSLDSNGVTWGIWKAIKVVNHLQSFPEFYFNCSNNAVTQVNDSLIVTKEELRVHWDKEKAADEYDLEWTFIDSSALKNYRKQSDTTQYDPAKLFRNNATRVSITQEAYHIPLLYESSGHLFYRVRAVQVKSNGQRIESNWSSNYTPGLGRYDFDGHEDQLNWQASTSFAEEGKRKSVVQYYDGSLRARQTVTKDNNTDTTIIAESFYDYQGRPVIQVLPAPSLSTIIKYTPNFNSPVNGGEYTKDLYDGLLTDSCFCKEAAPEMDTLTGASQYYSARNPLASGGIHRFIPNAQLYPFAETRYTPDNTGRIAMQSGVGKAFLITDTTHPTRYYYGSADQEELDALFGTEAGLSSHYFKNMVRDANGQFSVSYVDMHGRTIATALAGKPAAKLDTLESNVNRTITKRLLDSTNNIINGTSIVSTKGLIVTKAGNHVFQYSLAPEKLELEDCSDSLICYDCVYDLEIKITDDCNNSTLPGGVPIVISASNLTFDTACNTNTFPAVNETIFLREGSYMVTKTLTINKQGMDFFRDKVFMRRNMCKSLQDFIDEQKELLANLICQPTCESCLAGLGSFETFRQQYMEQMGIAVADSAVHRPDAIKAFGQRQEECQELCGNTGLNKSIREQMLADVSAPSGQYADVSDVDAYSIFYLVEGSRPYQSGIQYVDENGVPDPLAITLIPDVFSDNFKVSWADSLLRLHPEYYKLEKYDEFNLSHIWDLKFENTETFQAAIDSGYLNPANFSGLPNTAIFAYESTRRDPFFTDLAPAYKQRMLDSLNRKVVLDAGTADYINAWSFATIMAHCPTGDEACMDNFKPVSEAFSIPDSCSGDLDIAWQYFREMYLQEKREIMHVILQEYHDLKGEWNLDTLAKTHTLNFVNPSTFPQQNLVASEAAGTDSVNAFIDSNCVALAKLWWQELEPCGFPDSLENLILSRLINICREGGDLTHPFGASSVRPESEYSFRSFEQFLKHICDSTGYNYDTTCNVYLISAPPLYEQPKPVNEKPILQKPDDCECGKINSYYTQYQNEGIDTSFAAFVHRTTGVRIYDGVLDTLRKICNDEIDCRFLKEMVMLPTVLQCGIENACIGCTQFKEVYKEFLQEFGGAEPTYADIDSTQQAINILFRRFMNQKLGFSFSHEDYLRFRDSCSIPADSATLFASLDTTTITCTQLDELTQAFYYLYLNPIGGTVDLPMTTFAGNKTPLEGPKGVFNVNEQLIGRTVDGSTTAIDSSFAAIWNTDSANQVVGEIFPVGNGRFRLHLKPGQQVPCNGLTGMRYYEFNTHASGTLGVINVALGSYIEWGDSTYLKPEFQFADSLNTVDVRPFAPAYREYKYLFDDSYVWPYSFSISHNYPVTGSLVTYSVAVYHSDTIGIVAFNERRPISQHTSFSNLRGYWPQDLKQLQFLGTRDSTINRTREIRNFTQISSIQGIHLFQSTGPSPFAFNNLGSFENNHDLQHLSLDPNPTLFPGYPNSDSLNKYYLKHFYENFPNVNTNFPNLSLVRLLAWPARENDLLNFNFQLPRLEHLEIVFFSTFPAGLADSIFNQVDRVTITDSGFIWIDGAPTSASLTARNDLIANNWKLVYPGLNMGSWPVPPFRDIIATNTSLPLVHPFTDYANQRLGTAFTWEQLKNYYNAKCSNIPDFCGGPVLNGLTLCGKTEPVFPSVNFEQISPCRDTLLFAVSVGTVLYQAYRDSIINHFNDQYLEKCLGARKLESFTVVQPMNEYHYTLYYYDLAGNLVKTIPPAGVNTSKFAWATAWSDTVAAARAAQQIKRVSHGLLTNYRYNTLNQVVAQASPDGGMTEFWYDRLGRITLSRNAKQRVASTSNYHLFSFTQYDHLGRIKLVGQINEAATTSSVSDALTRNESSLQAWYGTYNNYRHQVTETVYDTAYFTGIYDPIKVAQKNLRNRVSYVTYRDTTGAANNFNSAIFYSYDIGGNVDTLLQDYGMGDWGPFALHNIMNRNGNRWKKIVYKYDLVSGKVNMVMYQPGYADRFYHRYSYDAENRLILAESSQDSIVWERDARYEYYRHGPLARVVLGDQQVQGIDYAYTLQGWLKGINSTGGTTTHDMGQDAVNGDPNQYTARDAIGLALNYFAGDYTSVKGTISGIEPFPSPTGALNTAYRPLYNGNISSMSVYNRQFEGANPGPLALYNYKYDQLNRLTGMDRYASSLPGNNWAGVMLNDTMKERVKYDPNGNILNYTRYTIAGQLMDDLKYRYYAGSNQLRKIDDNPALDNVMGGGFILDIDSQRYVNNYVYDSIGNLIRDSSEKINEIKWNVYGKIVEIKRTPTGSVNVNNIKYFYDALGNRIGKVFDINGTKQYTWYVLDAQGNILSTYYAEGNSDSLKSLSLVQRERFIYGSSRLGMYNFDHDVDHSNLGPSSTQFYDGGTFARGWKQYELTNHLGNVLVNVSDRKIGVSSGGSLYSYYNPDIVSGNEYHPFGMLARLSLATTGKHYKFGFNGKEFDWEIKGWQNMTHAQFWEYDPRIGRRWNLDPRPMSGVSEYSAFNNNPIWFTDQKGDTAIIDDKGVLTRNDKNGDGLLFHQYSYKDRNGKNVSALSRIYLNDEQLDAVQMDNFDVGKKLVRFLNEEEVNWILYKTGADLPGTANDDLRLGIEAYTSFDFGAGVLRHNIAGQDGAEGLSKDDPYPEMWDQGGGFIFFKGGVVFRAFNIPDAGNFLFGAAASRRGVPYLKLLIGAQLNSGLTANGADTKADQSAIAQGFMYAGHLKSVHHSTYPFIGFLFDYDRKRPSWFDPKNDKLSSYRIK